MKRAVCVLLMSLILTCPVKANIKISPPAPGVLAIDPRNCRTGDKGFIYWAAADQVFRFKYKADEPIYPVDDFMNDWQKGKYLPAPDPREPKGCYGNPIRFVSVPYIYSFEETLFKKIAGRDFVTESTGVHQYDAIPQRNLNGDSYKDLFKKAYSESKQCWRRASGIYECLRESGLAAKNNYETSRYYKIDRRFLTDGHAAEDVYLRFKYDLAAARLEDGSYNGKHIESTIDLFGVVRLKSSFRLFSREIDLLIPYYRGLVGYVEQAHVSNYNWK
ncbi:hypothetical protein [Leeia aquatica]|uniref:Uncharacterized protein n=1 Tax=Leeia aquatica TaxID=2725557 RepID=A0A847S717_9NEIS|nr:hypothetical protein [Leeia aquatica]NLR74625.1 hypothetical protein [Leeia aquatica]